MNGLIVGSGIAEQLREAFNSSHFNIERKLNRRETNGIIRIKKIKDRRKKKKVNRKHNKHSQKH